MPRGKATSLELRRRIVDYRQQGQSMQAIATALSVSKSTVQYVLKHVATSGQLIPQKAKGGKRMLTPRDCNRLRRFIKGHRYSNVTDLMEWCRVNLDKRPSKRSIYRYVRRMNYRFYKAKRKPFVSPVNRRRRLAWARAYKGWTTQKWDRVLWSDESYFRVVFGMNGCRVLRTSKEADNPECYISRVQKPQSVCVWGCIASGGVGPLSVCNGTVDAQSYVNILQQSLPMARRTLFGNRAFTFQQDNARPHTARLTTAYLRQRRIRPLPWPASSPDLSPIENTWRFLKRKVNQRRPRTKEQLCRYIQEEWARIPVDFLRKQVHSVPRRLADVIRWKGAPTKW